MWGLSERIEEAFEECIFDELKQDHGEKDYALVRAVIKRQLKPGPCEVGIRLSDEL